ncbi:uncharacterized protein DNG_06170 [Cephalotrichum gorgonifer]|uniref:Cu_bind_like domain-containing protein n=1 Tax=Cephalotrichum gorgonifer TaxID=2041049 RepID=A0AAE8MZH5_9PEZI|nr:uncharacterized protein DNG_06170 [Cephalotrichum gorgonifer]
MKFSSALQLALAPLALAGSRQVRRDGHLSGGNVAVAPVAGGVSVGGVGHVGGLISGVNAVIIWVNQGGGNAAETINQQVTVTQTITVAAGAAPTAVSGVAGSTTIAAGSSAVVEGTGATHSVDVGGPQGLSFFPQEVSAQVGDMIIFTFYSQNHTVTQSSFDLPCEPLAGGMDSGFMANPDNSISPPPQVAMQVMTAEPLWMYCAQGNHCGRGMAFSINPSAEKTHAQFQANAIAQKGGDLPGTAITGGTGAAPADGAPAPPAAPAPPSNGTGGATSSLPGAALPTNVGGVANPIASAPVGGLNGGIVMGAGTVNLADGSCQCAVTCSGNGFPDPAAQGVNAFGGIAGSIDMASAGVVGAAVPSVGGSSAVSVATSSATAESSAAVSAPPSPVIPGRRR